MVTEKEKKVEILYDLFLIAVSQCIHVCLKEMMSPIFRLNFCEVTFFSVNF